MFNGKHAPHHHCDALSDLIRSSLARIMTCWQPASLESYFPSSLSIIRFACDLYQRRTGIKSSQSLSISVSTLAFSGHTVCIRQAAAILSIAPALSLSMLMWHGGWIQA